MEPGDGPVVRPAGAADAAAVAAVHEAAWRASLGPLLPPEVLCRLGDGDRRRKMAALARDPGPDHRMLVAERDGAVVGFVWFGRRPTELPPYQGQLHSLYVLPACQRSGVGGRLLREAAAALHDAGVAGMMLWVLETNGPARRFYERHGGAPLEAVRPFEFGGLRYPSHPMTAYGWDRPPGPPAGEGPG